MREVPSSTSDGGGIAGEGLAASRLQFDRLSFNPGPPTPRLFGLDEMFAGINTGPAGFDFFFFFLSLQFRLHPDQINKKMSQLVWDYRLVFGSIINESTIN